MFLPFFGRKPRLTEAQRGRLQALEGSDSAELAAELLRGPTALLQLTLPEARQVVSYMLPMRIPEGNTFIRQGDRQSTDFMVLVLEGEVTVDTIVVSRTQPMVVNVLGKGSLIGEMGLLDGEPRAASCTASSPLTCAILTRRALEERKVIDRAKGILMRARGIGEEDAYALLRKTAMDQGRKLAEVAQALVMTADLLK